LRVTGLTAPAVLDGPMDGPSFQAYVDQILVPTLQPGDCLILDNLSCRHQPDIRAAIKRVGAAVRYLPPYSPDCNPIEMLFAKLKAILRAARWRTTDALWTWLGARIPLFTATECANYVRHAGYGGATCA